VLVESGLLTDDQLQQALDDQRRPDAPRRRLGQVVVDLKMATERQVAECLANLLGLDMVDLSKNAPAPDTVQLLPRAVAERTNVLVLDKSKDGTLIVAASDPTNVLALDDVRLYTGSPDLQVVVATDSQIRDAIAQAWALGQGNSRVASNAGDSERDDDDETVAVVGDEIVNRVNQVLADAVRLRASDIHIESQRESLLVRFRIDGLLRDVVKFPKRIAGSVVSRIKIISGLDIAERRVPQDGRTRFLVNDSAIDARVSTLPSLHGEKVVIRLLTRGDAVPTLDSLGFEPNQLALLRSALATPQGLILITGPTGSGKTNTLYSAIGEISNPDINIVTLEDPVEVQLSGITQVGVSEKTGMTFSRGLRSILRQDPDIILVGEVRDAETASLALKASLTGHMVLTTLHTNSAVAALTRLVDMGAEPFLVASSLTAAIAQRLVRQPCPSCAEPYVPEELVLTGLGLTSADLETATPRRGTGCAECGRTGYRGRTGVYEVLNVDSAMRQVLIKDPSESAISAQARAAGMLTLRAAAIEKARRGETTFEEAVRVTHADHHAAHSCPACDRPVDQDMVVCPWCATTLDRGHCERCARTLEPDWKVCPWCRTPAPGPAYTPSYGPAPYSPAPYAAGPYPADGGGPHGYPDTGQPPGYPDTGYGPPPGYDLDIAGYGYDTPPPQYAGYDPEVRHHPGSDPPYPTGYPVPPQSRRPDHSLRPEPPA
jgi:type IV pilus assembly protein PilB